MSNDFKIGGNKPCPPPSSGRDVSVGRAATPSSTYMTVVYKPKTKTTAKDVVSHRDGNGKHVPDNSGSHHQWVPQPSLCQGKFRDSNYYGALSDCDSEVGQDGQCRHKEEEVVSNATCDRRYQRKGRGYESFSYTLSSTLIGRDSDEFQVTLQSQGGASHSKSVEAVHVENATLFVEDQRFPNSFYGTCDKTSANEIRFTEGVFIDCPATKLSLGCSVSLPRTFTPILHSKVLVDHCGCDDQTTRGGSAIKITVCQEDACLLSNYLLPCEEERPCPCVFLLETCNFVPSGIQFVPFELQGVDDHDSTLIFSPRPQHCIPTPTSSSINRCSSACAKKSVSEARHDSPLKRRPSSVLPIIPCDFKPDCLLVLPMLHPYDVASLLNTLVEEVCVKWDCCRGEYMVEQSCTARNIRLPTLVHGEDLFFLARVTPKRYCTASDLVPEIQRSMNPPFVSPAHNALVVDGVTVCIPAGEYPTPCDLARQIEHCVNNVLRWSGTFLALSVTYECDSGRFIFSRLAPFMMEFDTAPSDRLGNGLSTHDDDHGNSMCCSFPCLPTLAETLGFSQYLLIGNHEYVSNFQIYYVTRSNAANQPCANLPTPSNRYVASYDQCNDLISVRAVSRSDYTRMMLCSPCAPAGYNFACGHNFVIPFRFARTSPLTDSLEFVQKGRGSLEFVSSIGVSALIGPPLVLYLCVPQLDGDLSVSVHPPVADSTTHSEDCTSKSERHNCPPLSVRCMAVLQRTTNCTPFTYSSVDIPTDESTCRRNVTSKNETLQRLSIKLMDGKGRHYNVCGQTLLLNLRIVT